MQGAKREHEAVGRQAGRCGCFSRLSWTSERQLADTVTVFLEHVSMTFVCIATGPGTNQWPADVPSKWLFIAWMRVRPRRAGGNALESFDRAHIGVRIATRPSQWPSVSQRKKARSAAASSARSRRPLLVVVRGCRRPTPPPTPPYDRLRSSVKVLPEPSSTYDDARRSKAACGEGGDTDSRRIGGRYGYCLRMGRYGYCLRMEWSVQPAPMVRRQCSACGRFVKGPRPCVNDVPGLVGRQP